MILLIDEGTKRKLAPEFTTVTILIDDALM